MDCASTRCGSADCVASRAVVHDGFRRVVGLPERNPQGEPMSATESIAHDELADRATAITARELRHLHRAHARLAAGHRAGPPGAAARRAVQLPGLRPAPDRRAPGPGGLDGGRRRQPLHRLRHGLRRAVRRPLPPAGPRRRSRSSSTTARCSSRRARPTPTSPSCSASATACRCGASPTRGTEATMDAIRVARGVTGRDEDRQGRGRLPRPPRRGDDLDEAAARRGRPGRRARRRSRPPPASPTRVLADTHRHPVQRRRGARAGAARPATSPASSSSR